LGFGVGVGLGVVGVLGLDVVVEVPLDAPPQPNKQINNAKLTISHAASFITFETTRIRNLQPAQSASGGHPREASTLGGLGFHLNPGESKLRNPLSCKLTALVPTSS
jgi:hypothetical protein